MSAKISNDYKSRYEKLREEYNDLKTEKDYEILRLLSEPLRTWLRESYDLRCQIIIKAGYVKVTRDEIGTDCEIKD